MQRSEASGTRCKRPSPFPLHAVHLIAKVALPVDLYLTAVTKLALAEQHRARREDDGIGLKNDGLPGRTLRLRRDLLLPLSLTQCLA